MQHLCLSVCIMYNNYLCQQKTRLFASYHSKTTTKTLAHYGPAKMFSVLGVLLKQLVSDFLIATGPCKSNLWNLGVSPDLLCAQPPITHMYVVQFEVNIIEKLLLQLLLLPSDMLYRLKKLRNSGAVSLVPARHAHGYVFNRT